MASLAKIPGVAAMVCYGAVVRLPNAKEPTTLPLWRRYETKRHHQQRDDPVAVQNLRCFTDQAAQRYHQRSPISCVHPAPDRRTSLAAIAGNMSCSTRTLQRKFDAFWLVDVPDPTIGHTGRVYDQIFIDGTYTAGGCLIVAATLDHVIAWHWCKQETTHDYKRLLERIEAPLIAVIDGGRGATSAIKTCWPNTKIQRCLVHAQRRVRRYTTSRPRTDAGRTIYRLALKLTRITTLDEAAQWGAQLQEFHTLYKDWLNEKTQVKDPKTAKDTLV